MTIASEITDLQANLAAAKDAVTNKGGTVGDTGLAGLATEIASIPSGGGGEDWGTVTYTNGGVSNTVTIQSLDEYMQLGQVNGGNITIGGVTFNYYNITGVALGKSATFTPHYFLRDMASVDIELTGTENLLIIGDSFLYNCAQFNKPLDLSNVTSIGDYFLANCYAFNSNITFSKLTKIGGYFMQACSGFSKTLTIPATVQVSIGANFMYNCEQFTNLVCNAPSANSVLNNNNNTLATTNNSAPMYVNGVTLTGTQASRWKNRYANRTSSPYRKLILGT